jgi:hypothetical protein
MAYKTPPNYHTTKACLAQLPATMAKRRGIEQQSHVTTKTDILTTQPKTRMTRINVLTTPKCQEEVGE